MATRRILRSGGDGSKATAGLQRFSGFASPGAGHPAAESILG